jgi:hypothetical protein
VKVQTNVQAGAAIDGAQAAAAKVKSAVGGVIDGARATVSHPRVNATIGKLMWWPFGRPRF